MFDPAALGTLVIGLDHAQRENAFTDRPTPSPRPQRDRRLTRTLAVALRRLADVIDAPRRQPDFGLEP
jgi:hypothetical protein